MLYTERRRFTADDLLTLPDDGWRYEIVRGRLIQMAPTGVDHGAPTDNLYFAMGQYVRAHGLGKLYPAETGFNLRRPDETEDTVLAADITFVRADRVPASGEPAYPLLAPDLVVEVASEASQRPKDMADKALLWLSRDVRLVWVVWPRRQAIDVWRPGDREARQLGRGDELDGGAVLSGFRYPVAEVFRYEGVSGA